MTRRGPTRRDVLASAAAWAAAAPFATARRSRAFARRREGAPNVVVFLADDLGTFEGSGDGRSAVPTPHIDALARDGV